MLVLIACWSVKGGVGTTVVASALAVTAARCHPGGALLVDLAGEAGTVAGVQVPTAAAAAAGVTDWLASGAEAPAGALHRLEIEASAGLGFLPRGDAPLGQGAVERAEALARELGDTPRAVVIDCGVAATGWSVPAVLAGAATVSLLVLRNCYLAVRRATATPLRPSGVVLIEEPGRSMTAPAVASALGVPVVAQLPFDPAVARAVDAGLLQSRLPRPVHRALRRLL